MPGTTSHVAEVTDPITGDTTTLTANTADELDQLVDAHLAQAFPAPADRVDPNLEFEFGRRGETPPGPGQRKDDPHGSVSNPSSQRP